MRILVYTSLLVLAIMLAGCSGGSKAPTAPQDNETPEQIANTPNNEMVLLSSGIMDLEAGTIEPDRTSSAYMNVTPYLGSNFSYTIDSYTPPTFEITLKINNTTLWTVHDVCIVFENTGSMTVNNPDSWMDIFGPYDLDPFIAFRKEDPNRAFPPGVDTEHLTISGPVYPVQYFIIAHLGGNTFGVYDLDVAVSGTLTPTGGNANLTATSRDHQGDIGGVWADTTIFTGGIVQFNSTGNPEIWTKSISNTAGAPVGIYPRIAMSNSQGAPPYNCYDYFDVEVKEQGQANIVTEVFVPKEPNDYYWDVGVVPGGFVYVVADHGSTGNIGGDPVAGSRTCLQFSNNLGTMNVINPGGSGMASPYPTAWDWEPGLEWKRVDASDGGNLITNVGDAGIATWSVAGTTATYAACCWMFTCSPYPARVIDVCDFSPPLGFGPSFMGFGRTALLCSPVANWTLAFQDTDLVNYSAYNYTPAEIYSPIEIVVGIEGLKNTQDMLALINDGRTDRLVKYGDCFSMAGNSAELASYGSYGTGDGQFKGGLDLSINKAGEIVTLENHGGTFRFQKFDSAVNHIYSSVWIDNGDPLRIDFDRVTGKLYCVSTAGVHLMNVL
ncbi:MAG: hypothetical protein ABIG42_00905 [bacterium]